MSVISATANYVKFIRGTPTAYNNLLNKDADTLYFITAAGASSGTLYLGDKIIGGASSLTQLGDLLLTNVGNRQILSYDAGSNKWINTNIETLIGQMGGASATTNGTAGLVPQPIAGDQRKFLRGDGTWATIDLGDAAFNDKIFASSSNGITIKGFTAASSGQLMQKNDEGTITWVSPSDLTAELQTAITNLQTVVNGIQGGIQRRIVNSISDINVNATDADKYIYMVPNGDSNTGNIYSEYMVIQGQVELIGSNLSGDLTGYVKTSAFNTAIGTINDKFNNYVLKTTYAAEVGDLRQLLKSQSNGDTLVDQVNDLTTRLTWYEVTDV